MQPIRIKTQGFQKRGFVRFNNRPFQWKFTLIIAISVALAFAALAAPILYFTYQNYTLFLELSYQVAPEILDHLEREQMFLMTYVATGWLAITAFFFILALRMSDKICSPIFIVERNLRKVAKGQLYLPDIKVRKHDEFPELIEAFNYLSATLRHNTKTEMELLKSLPVEDSNSQFRLRSIIEAKGNQVNKQVS